MQTRNLKPKGAKAHTQVESKFVILFTHDEFKRSNALTAAVQEHDRMLTVDEIRSKFTVSPAFRKDLHEVWVLDPKKGPVVAYVPHPNELMIADEHGNTRFDPQTEATGKQMIKRPHKVALARNISKEVAWKLARILRVDKGQVIVLRSPDGQKTTTIKVFPGITVQIEIEQI